MSTSDFDIFFAQAVGQSPFPYQRRLAESRDFPGLLHVPTGAGKTAAAILAWLWRRRENSDPAIRAQTPRRLIYCLPTRVLVEQTRDAVREWLDNLGLHDDRKAGNGRGIAVTVLMGGELDRDWCLFPEREAILIGTQDMLLSRALNRGYAESRFRWPVSFGLLNSDCLWVFDEIQLMGPGLATSAQLAAFREILGTFGPSVSLWMSATLERRWLGTVDFRPHLDQLTIVQLDEHDHAVDVLARRLTARKILRKAHASLREGQGGRQQIARWAQELAAEIESLHARGELTLVVTNTVARAKAVYNALRKTGTGPLLLVHSQFRPHEREALNTHLLRDLAASGGVAVTTQVIEAGVNISAATLFTELAPWPSLVQRFGRCNRFGEAGIGCVRWIDLPDDVAAPYEPAQVAPARDVVERLEGASVEPNNLPAVDSEVPPPQVIRRKDIVDLFDTTPDLSGNDVDISRFIREPDDQDVQVFWREWDRPSPPSAMPGPVREELCPAPVKDLRDLARREPGWVWDHLDGAWRRAREADIRPGIVLLLPANSGHYSVEVGWDLGARQAVVPVEIPTAPAAEQATGDNPETHTRAWVSLPDHTDAVVDELRRIAGALGDLDLDGRTDALREAARWHDVGKAHPAFQDSLLGRLDPPEREQRRAMIWAKSGAAPLRNDARPHFRHELASALAFLANCDDQTPESDLAAYLIAAHHGKVRVAIRSLAGEKVPDAVGGHYALGIWDGDVLPALELPSGTRVQETALDLSLVEIGEDDRGRPSWLQRSLRLRDQLGPFRLAFLEALVRIADWRASAKEEGETR